MDVPRRRLLYPGLLIAMVALFAVQPVLARAAAAVVERERPCCCPDPATCPCHDHDDDSGPRDSELRRCGTDVTVVVAAVLVASLPSPPPVPPAPPLATTLPPIQVELPTGEPARRPVTPPF